MGDLARKGTSKTFRQLAEHVPLQIRNRVTELLDSVVFIQDPLLKDVRWLGVTTSDGEPTASVASSDGLGLHIGGGTAYLTWRWKGVFYSQPFGSSSSAGGSSGGGDYATVDHEHSWPSALDDLDDVRMSLVHDENFLIYRSRSRAWGNIEIDELSELVAPYIDHGLLTGLDDDDHPAYLLASDATDRATFAANWTDLTDGHDTTLHTHQHELLYGIGYYDHAHIDNHLDDTDFFHDHGNLTGLADDDHEQYLLRSEWLQNGFVDKDEVAIAWDDGTRTLTISPAVTSFRYYYDGILYTETGSLAAQITDTEGLWAFYIGSGGAASLSTIHSPTYEQVEDAILNQTIVAYVYWDATNNDGRLMDERHGARMSPETHHYLHELFGAQYNTGMTLGDILVDQAGSSDTHAQFSITAGRFYDEDVEHDTLAHASTDTWECYYVDGSGDVRWVNCEATFPVYAIGGVIAWNNAGTLTAADNNKYICYHVFSTNIHADDGGDYYPVVTPGIAQYGSKAAAQDAALSEIQSIDFGDWPKEEIIPIATVIYKHLSSMSNGVEAAIQSTEGGGDFVDWRFTAVSGSSTSVNDHGALSGLTDDDHAQYALLTGARPFVGDLSRDSGGVYAATLGVDRLSITASGTIGRVYRGGSFIELGYIPLGGATYDALRVVPGAVPQYISGATPYDLALADDLDDYLPLTAGSTKPLTGSLYTEGNFLYHYLRWDSSGAEYLQLGLNDSSTAIVKFVADSTPASLWIDSSGGASDGGEIAFFRGVNYGTGTKIFEMHVGDGSDSPQHSFNAGTGDVDLCQQGGQVTIGGSGGAQKLTVVGGQILLDNANGIIIKDSGGTEQQVLVVSSVNRCQFGNGNLRLILASTDWVRIAADNSAIADGAVAASEIVPWIDETNHRLYFKVKYSDGTTVKSGYISLS